MKYYEFFYKEILLLPFTMIYEILKILYKLIKKIIKACHKKTTSSSYFNKILKTL